MKKRLIRKWSYVGMMMFIIIGLVGCIGPYMVEMAVEVDSNSTAFIIPLEMSTLDGQATVVSKEFLDKHKVSAKRIILNQRKRKTGRWWWKYEYIPTERVIQVDRTPVTREWITGETKDGKRVALGFPMASQDSVGFTVGINLTCMIEEDEASVFLYNFKAKPLEEVVDEVVRGFVQNALSAELMSRPLTACQQEKVQIIESVQRTVEANVRKYGITLVTIGLADEYTYDNPKVQEAVDNVFVNETKVKQAEQAQKEAAIINATLLEKEQNDNAIALQKALNDEKIANIYADIADIEFKRAKIKCMLIKAEAQKVAAENWDGKTPRCIMPEGVSLIYPFNAMYDDNVEIDEEEPDHELQSVTDKYKVKGPIKLPQDEVPLVIPGVDKGATTTPVPGVNEVK